MKILRNSSIITLAVVALALVAAPVAMADSVTVYSNTITDTTSVSSNMGTLSVAGFYSAPGVVAGDTLTSVTVILSGDAITYFTASVAPNYNPPPGTNPPANGTSGSATINSFTTNGSITATGVGTPLTLTLSGTYSLPTPQTITAVAPNSAYYNSGVYEPIASGTVTANPSDLADYAISGTINFVLSGAANSSVYATDVSNAFSVAGGGYTDAGGKIEIIYNYSDGNTPGVPEPGTLSLFGTGLLGLAGMLRYKFSKAS